MFLTLWKKKIRGKGLG